MDNLLNKFAELLNITIDKAIELYPMFRKQFVIYNVLDMLHSLSVLSLGILVFLLIMVVVFWLPEENDDDLICKVTKKIFKAFIINLTILIITHILIYVFCSDLMILKMLLNK